MTESESNRPVFKHVGGWLCLDFLNTQNWGTHEPIYERFFHYFDFLRFARHFELLTAAEIQALREEAERQPEVAARAFARGLALRDLLHRIFSAVARERAPDEADLNELNTALSRAMVHLRLKSSGKDFTWDWEKVAGDLEQPFWPVLFSAAELLTSEKLKRLGQCAAESCGWLFLDLSRNHSRRWCEMQHCGNRDKARRHYRRSKVAKTQEA